MMDEYPFALEYTIYDYCLSPLKDSAENDYLQSDEFEVAPVLSVYYYLRIYPNGDSDEHRGQTWIYLQNELKYKRTVEAEYTLSIKSAEWSHKINHVFEKNDGRGAFCCTVNELFDSNKKFITDGKLIIKVEGVMKIAERKNRRRKSTSGLYQSNNSFRDLWNIGYEDFLIIAEQKEIKVHKCVLAAHSPVFDAMFKSGMKEAVENRVELPDFSFETVEMAIKLCYNIEIDSTPSIDEIFMLLKFTDKYDMAVHKKNLEEYLSGKLTVSNACQIVNGAIAGNSLMLQNQCLEFFTDCLSKKYPVPNMEILDKDFLVSIYSKFSCHKAHTF